MYLGFRQEDSTTENPGLKRSIWPTWRIVPAFLAAVAISLASGTVAANGFSTRQGMPLERNSIATPQWYLVGVTIDTASTSGFRLSAEAKTLHPCLAAIDSACCR